MFRFLCIDDDRDYLANIKYHIAEYGAQVTIMDRFASSGDFEADQEGYDILVINGEMLLGLDRGGLENVMQWCSWVPIVVVHDGNTDNYGRGFEKVVAFVDRSKSYAQTALRLMTEAKTSAGLDPRLSRAG